MIFWIITASIVAAIILFFVLKSFLSEKIDRHKNEKDHQERLDKIHKANRDKSF